MKRQEQEAGFTLLESLFQLLIAAAFLHLLVLFLFYKDTVHQQLTDSQHVEWELFMADLQADMALVHTVHVDPGGKLFKALNANQQLVEYSAVNGVIRRRIDRQGHVPLLTSIRTADFSRHGEYLTVSVSMPNGEERKRRIAVGLVEK